MRRSLPTFLSANHIKQFIFPGFLVCSSLLIQATTLNDSLDLQRSLVEAGHWWLVITGHLCHLHWPHWLINNLALIIIWELFYRQRLNNHRYSLFQIGLECTLLAIGVGLGVLLFNPEVEWYVGLSGVLHGMFVIGISHDLRRKSLLSVVAMVIFLAKIIWEQLFGPSSGFLIASEAVLVDAHLYGAIAGVLISFFYWLSRYNKFNINAKNINQ